MIFEHGNKKIKDNKKVVSISNIKILEYHQWSQISAQKHKSK